MSKKLKFCLIGSKTNQKTEEDNSITLLVKAAEKANVILNNIPKGRIILSIDNHIGFRLSGNDVDIREQDLFIFRDVSELIHKASNTKVRIFAELCMVASHIYYKLGKPVFDSFIISGSQTNTKVVQAYTLMQAGLPVIPTYAFFRKDQVLKNIDKFKFPLFLKPADGSKGRDTYLFRTREDLLTFLRNYNSPIFYPNIFQDFIDNDGDYRIVVLGDEVIASIFKIRPKDSIVSNMSKGAKAIPTNIPNELKDIAIKAAKTLNIEFAGVDIIQDKKTGKFYVLEVNLSPQITLTSYYSKVNIAEIVIQYLIQKCK